MPRVAQTERPGGRRAGPLLGVCQRPLCSRGARVAEGHAAIRGRSPGRRFCACRKLIFAALPQRSRAWSSTCISTTSLITSVDELTQRNGLAGLREQDVQRSLPNLLTGWRNGLDTAERFGSAVAHSALESDFGLNGSQGRPPKNAPSERVRRSSMATYTGDDGNNHWNGDLEHRNTAYLNGGSDLANGGDLMDVFFGGDGDDALHGARVQTRSAG